MKRSSIKFLHRVRIHGGEFDASARAMHRDGMTSSFQAAAEKLSIATNERIQMSTKTTFKRVALVTVAALGFGLLSIAPSSAVPTGDTLSIDAATDTAVTSETATAVVTQTFVGLSAGDSMSVQALITTAPAGGEGVSVKLSTNDSTTARITYAYASGIHDAATTSVASAGGATTIAHVSSAAAGGGAPAAALATAKFNLQLVSLSVAGTYVVGLFPSKTANAGVAAVAAASAPTVYWTVTVTAADVNASAALTTSYIAAGSAIGAVTDSATVAGSMAITEATQAGTITVTQANSAGTANESMTVVVSGPGSVASHGTLGSITRSTNAGRAITVKKGDYIGVWSDGSSGVATVTITGATSKAVLGVETVTFYGSVATITTTVRTSIVSSLGGATSGASALIAVAKDSLGTVIPAGSLYAQSGTTASIPDATCTYSSTYKGHACSLVPVASKTGSVTFTVRNAVRATTVASTTISAADVSVTLGEAPSKVAMSFDKALYGQGEAAKLSLTLTDKNGKPVANGVYNDILDADGIESTYTLTGLVDTSTVTAATSTGTMVLSVNMPIAEVDIAVTGTTGTGFATLADQGVAVAAGVVSVKSNSSSAATDAANEATDAANAATDAANAAAEAADAATAAAQDAADAVAALSTEVASLIAALKAQITSLTNLVIKIQKKVKA